MQESIDHLDQLARHLRSFVAPLRTFLEDVLGLGNTQVVRMAACGLDPARSGKPREEVAMKDSTDLFEKISESLIDSQFDTGATRMFAPNELIRGLVLPNTVRDTLAKGLPSVQEVDQDLVDYIVFKARKLFAICLMQRLKEESLLKAMVLFKGNSMSDTDLPLEQTIHDAENDDWEKSPQKSLGAEDTAVPSNSTMKFGSKLHEIDPNEEIWKNFGRRSFIENHQWMFLAPVFSTKDETQNLKQSSVLPFPRRGKLTEGGGFGIVSRIVIQEEHIEDPGKLVRFFKIPKVSSAVAYLKLSSAQRCLRAMPSSRSARVGPITRLSRIGRRSSRIFGPLLD